jgi:hypothetical protein
MATDKGTCPKYTPQALRAFWELQGKIIVQPNGCWLWQRAKAEFGYGLMSYNGIFQRAHRVAYVLCIAPVPPGLSVLHNCPGGDNPSCVNPEHLFLGTQLDNVQDCIRKGRTRLRAAPAGERNPHAKLTEDDVRSIRAKVAAGVPQTRIQVEYDLSRAGVQRIVSRRAWMHVPDHEPIQTIWGTF